MSIQIDNTNAGTLTLKPASSGSYTLTFPSAVAAVNGYVLSSDTSGTLSWAAGGGGGTTTNALTIGTGLSGTSFNGSSAVTIAIDSTVATKAQSFIISMIFGGI